VPVARCRPRSSCRVVEFRLRSRNADASGPSGDQHLTVRQQRLRLKIGRSNRVAGESPRTGRRIVEFRAPFTRTSYDEHLSVLEQCCCVPLTSFVHIPGGRPQPACRIVEFRGRSIEAIVITTRDEHLPVEQQRRCLTTASSADAAGRCPVSSGRVVEFRAPEGVAACYEYLPVE